MSRMHQVNIRALDLNLLLVLDALLAEHSVSKAARRLHSTQPSVSRALAQLRSWFGEPLFVRSRHGMSPTPRAELLRVELSALLEQLDRLVQPREAFVPAVSTRTFRLATADYAQALVLSRLVTQLNAEAPGVSLVVEPWAMAAMVESLETGRLDLVLAPMLDRPVRLQTRALFSDEFVVIARRDHPLAARPLSVRKFAAAGHVQIAPDGREGGVVDDALRTRGLERRVVLRVPGFTVAPMVVASSDLLAVVPARLAAVMSEAWPIAILRAPLALPLFTLAMFWHERAHSDRALMWLRERLASGCADRVPTPRQRTARLRLDQRARGTL